MPRFLSAGLMVIWSLACYSFLIVSLSLVVTLKENVVVICGRWLFNSFFVDSM